MAHPLTVAPSLLGMPLDRSGRPCPCQRIAGTSQRAFLKLEFLISLLERFAKTVPTENILGRLFGVDARKVLV